MFSEVFVCPQWGEGRVSLVPGPFQGVGYPGSRVSSGEGIQGVRYPEGGIPYPLPDTTGGYFGGRYASYWNAFLFLVQLMQ